MVIRFTVFAVAFSMIGVAAYGQIPFEFDAPGLDQSQLKKTTFATGLNYPVGMAELDDGSIVVAVSNGSSFFGSSSGSILRLADEDGDGVAEVRQTLVGNVPGGGLSALRRAGDFLFTTGQGRNKPISVYRLGENPSDSLTSIGQFVLSYPTGGWLHPHSALAVRDTPGMPDHYDLFFQLGSDTNFAVTTRTVNVTSSGGDLTGDIDQDITGDGLHMIRLAKNANNMVDALSLDKVATGLRNPAGMDFHPETGDLYLEDNGIDGFVSAIEPESADELNFIPLDQIGGSVEDFGFPNSYIKYRTGEVIGSQGIQPLVAFQPIPAPNGAEGEGPNDITFAPELFPEPLQGGIFVGMHGQFSRGGVSNEENPLVYVDLSDNSYQHVVKNTESAVGHLDGLLATRDSLFIADISPSGGFGGGTSNTGAIYKIQSLVPEPSSGCGLLVGLLAVLGGVRGRKSRV